MKNNALPDFIGIGVQKGGTSWLYRQLLNHSQVFVPEMRKEIHFFDWYYDRGLSWYQKWFPPKENNYKAVGEFTPNYLYDENAFLRVKEICPDAKLIIMLRDPVRRAYSHYQMNFQSGGGQEYSSFDDFMENHLHAFNRGLYASQIELWLSKFDKENFLIIISEEIFKKEDGINQLFKKISLFLNIDLNLFNIDLAKERVGKARLAPKYKLLANTAQKVRLFLRKHDLDFVAIFFKKIGLTRQIFGSSSVSIPELTKNDIEKWSKRYAEDRKKLEFLLEQKFVYWD